MNAILTVDINTDDGCYTIPAMRQYADRVGAKLIVITEPKYRLAFYEWLKLQDEDAYDYNYLNFEKNQIIDYLDNYDRILRLDADVLIKPQAPDIFAVKSNYGFLAVPDAKPKKKMYLLRKSNFVLSDDYVYFNSGVILTSPYWFYVFRMPPITKIDLGYCKEQTLLNMHMAQRGVYDQLDKRYNYIRHWGWDKRRQDAYFIHYAGIKGAEKANTLKDDYRYFYG